ncbi:hypothetical protein RMSM_03511 [Rhodopirellula maiorica SM1]|uniref:Uncharacterized protein n=1 Tax=Rhodopirellula maiorica SM1 TaxID=1265738 RepID=M5RK25_9BACT|nr:hypothetical protein [Rhodopirellula maiorica]EMI19551.1 hypothetical protein RMSM_03511 [Rhodopirellula maiorica SM1]
MSSIVTVSNRDRGFARLGPETDPIYRALRNLLEARGYEHEVQGSDIWVRYANRCNGPFPNNYARIVNTFSSFEGVSGDFAWLHELDARYDGVGQTASADECRELFQKAASDPDYKFLHWLDAALMLCRREQRRDFIANDYLPAFMNRFPEGRIVFIGTNYDLDERLPLLRHGNFYQINGRQAIDDMRAHNVSSPATASALHLSGVLALDNALSVLMANLLPLRTHVIGGTMQLRVVYLFGEDNPSVIDRGPHPREEIELQKPTFFYAATIRQILPLQLTRLVVGQDGIGTGRILVTRV